MVVVWGLVVVVLSYIATETWCIFLLDFQRHLFNIGSFYFVLIFFEIFQILFVNILTILLLILNKIVFQFIDPNLIPKIFILIFILFSQTNYSTQFILIRFRITLRFDLNFPFLIFLLITTFCDYLWFSFLRLIGTDVDLMRGNKCPFISVNFLFFIDKMEEFRGVFCLESFCDIG